MLDKLLVELYIEALRLKAQQEEIAEKQEDNARRGFAIKYIDDERADADAVIGKYRGSLKSHLIKLVEEDDFKDAEFVLGLLNNPSLIVPKAEEFLDRNGPAIKSPYQTPLPESIYADAGNFSDLIDRAIAYRNANLLPHERKLFVTSLGRAIGAHEQYLHSVRQGKYRPSRDKTARLALFLNGDVEKFLKIAKVKPASEPDIHP